MPALTLPRPDTDPVVLMLSPLPLGFHQRLVRHGVRPPAPPARIARDAAGRPLKDAAQQVVTFSDDRAPDYLAAIDLYHQRLATLMARFALGDGSDSPFRAPCPDGATADWTGWADALFEDLVVAGWLAGDLLRVCQAISQASNLVDPLIEETQRRFS